VDEASFPADDRPDGAWDYDFLRSEIGRLIAGRRFNLQETVAREIYDLVAARRGVTGLRSPSESRTSIRTAPAWAWS
jgi:dihydroneopterin aldolase